MSLAVYEGPRLALLQGLQSSVKSVTAGGHGGEKKCIEFQPTLRSPDPQHLE